MEKGSRDEPTDSSSASTTTVRALALTDLDSKKEEVEGKETDKWSWGLPKEIIEMFLDRLAFPDNLRFAAVCVPWKRVAAMGRNHLLKYPWVMFSYTRQTQTSILSFFSLSENRVYDVGIPWIEARQCLGSCQGWILASNPSPKDCFLFNPFLREAPIIKLPYLNIWAGKSVHCWHSQNFFRKLILSSNPTDPDCLVLAITDSCGLAYCRLGDGKWVVFEDVEGSDFGEDIVFYNGQVYALSETGHHLMALDMENPVLSDEDFHLYLNQEDIFALFPRKEDINVCPFIEIVDQEPLFRDASFYQNYLVQSQGNLLLVSRIFRHATENLDDRDFFTRCECGRKIFTRRNLQTIRFLVYMLVKCNPESSGDSTCIYNWVKQSTLGDDQVLFLGRGFCQSLSTVDCPGLKGNTIYFTDDGKLVLNPPQQRDMGIYHLDDGQIESLLPFDCSQFNVLPFWIIPST